jgi:hypothetical protein
VITLKVDFVLNNSVGYRAAAMHASGKYLCAIDENYAVHDFCMDSACALGEENQVPVASPNDAFRDVTARVATRRKQTARSYFCSPHQTQYHPLITGT